VLCEEMGHDGFTVLLGSGVLPITAVQFFGHPIGKGPFVSLNGRQLVGVLAHVVGQGVGKGGGEWLPAIEPFRREPQRCSLEARITR
jgi:hypothetical protein